MIKKEINSTKSCAVASCPSPSGVSYHMFPKDQKLQKLWVDACKRNDFVNVRTASICRNHFIDEDFDRDFRNEMLKLPLRSLLKSGNQLGLEKSTHFCYIFNLTQTLEELF